MSLQLSGKVKREDIVCPGDTVTLLCFIQSNSENLYLEWEITLPGANRPIRVTYNSEATSDINVTRNLDMIGSVTLTNYTHTQELDSGYFESTLTVAPKPWIIVKCATDIRYEMFVFNVSGMHTNPTAKCLN